jgi:hypothetical protein
VTQPLIEAGPVTPPPPPDPARARRTARQWGLLLLAGWLCQLALRVLFSRWQGAPLANPDETAYLVTARVLAGGPAANLSYSTLYPVGYPLLITPVFWFTTNPLTAYHAVLVINSVVSALLMPLAYVAGRRLNLSRPLAYAVAMVTALVPAGFFYSQYALTDAIYPVVTLAWLLTAHSWLTARTLRGRWMAAVGSALLAGYADMVHSRGLVILACYAVFGVVIFVRRMAPRDTVVAAALSVGVMAFASWALNLHVSKALYPSGARSLSGQAKQRLHSVHGVITVLEMAAGQIWRLTLDSWGVAALGLVVAVVVIIRRGGTPAELRLIAALAVAVTVIIAVTAPAALPTGQPQAWASGRYLDGMIATFFVVGAATLLRAPRRDIRLCAALVIPPVVVAGIAVDAYAGTAVPTNGFSAAFNFAEPAVLTQNWYRANVALATLVAMALLGLWVGLIHVLPQRRRAVVLAGLALVSIAATAQMSITISRASAQIARAQLVPGLVPSDQVAVDRELTWQVWIPEAYQISWTQLKFFNPATSPPPEGATVVLMPWTGNSPRESWPQPPAGWHVVSSSQVDGWVAWRDTP